MEASKVSWLPRRVVCLSYGSQNDAAELHDEALTHDLINMNLVYAFRVIITKIASAEGKVTQATWFLS